MVAGSLGLGGITFLLAPLDDYPFALAMGAVGLGLVLGVANESQGTEGLPTLLLALALCLGAIGVGLYGFNKAEENDVPTLVDPNPDEKPSLTPPLRLPGAPAPSPPTTPGDGD